MFLYKIDITCSHFPQQPSRENLILSPTSFYKDDILYLLDNFFIWTKDFIIIQNQILRYEGIQYYLHIHQVQYLIGDIVDKVDNLDNLLKLNFNLLLGQQEYITIFGTINILFKNNELDICLIPCFYNEKNNKYLSITDILNLLNFEVKLDRVNYFKKIIESNDNEIDDYYKKIGQIFINKKDNKLYRLDNIILNNRIVRYVYNEYLYYTNLIDKKDIFDYLIFDINDIIFLPIKSDYMEILFIYSQLLMYIEMDGKIYNFAKNIDYKIKNKWYLYSVIFLQDVDESDVHRNLKDYCSKRNRLSINYANIQRQSFIPIVDDVSRVKKMIIMENNKVLFNQVMGE